MKLGDSFLMTVPPAFDCDHLWFVISDPTKHNGNYVVVNITTDVFRAGKECTLNSSDHEWISETSYVSFTDAREIKSEDDKTVTSFIGTKITMKAPLQPKVLKRIVEAAKKSKAIRVHLKKYL